jgi:small GTP-binding protein
VICIKNKKVVFKVALLGDPAVGKTSLINRYTDEIFKESYQPTLGVNIVMKKLKINDIKVQLVIWDIAGQDKYELTRKLFFEGCAGALLVYDLTRHSTFERIKTKWFEDFRKFARSNGVYILIGNKVDLKSSKTVSSEKAESFAHEIKASDFIETSTKSGTNVESAFIRLTSQVLENISENVN